VSDSSSVRTPPPSIFSETPRSEMLKQNKYMSNGMASHRIAGPTTPRMARLIKRAPNSPDLGLSGRFRHETTL
jgi:hypothetical protein